MSATPELPPAIFLMGPTAAGKTDLTFALHAELPVEVISVDAAQVYRGMDIGTAKPTPAERARVPHRLIDIRDPAEPYSAAQFCTDALREMAAITAAGRIPFLSGGTMFYFRALERGLAELPSADPALRSEIAARAAQVGWPVLHAELAQQDAASAAKIDPHDAQRIQRALEIVAITGRPRGEAQLQAAAFPYRAIKLCVAPTERKTLHERIAARFEAMLARGLVAEVELLYRRGDLTPALPSIRTVGYRQVWAYLAGELNYTDMAARAVFATRQLAKRQLTWLRADAAIQWFESTDTKLVRNSVSWVRQALSQAAR